MNRFVLLTIAACLSLSGMAFGRALAYDPPLPPPRPPELRATPERPSQPALREAPEKEPPQAPAPQSCTARLRDHGYDLSMASLPAGDQSACHVDEPVSLRAIKGSDGSMIRIAGDPVLACRMAEALGQWVEAVASPIVSGALGSPLSALRDVSGYECRNRNRRPDGKLSAHAQGLAIDIGTFEAKNGTLIAVNTQQAPAMTAVAALRRAACGWFLTVLGPGTDPDHATHLHLDLQQHGSSDRYRICQ